MDNEIMLGVPEEETEDIMLDEHRAMVCLPEDSVEVTIDAKVFHDGGIINVRKILNMQDLRTAFRKADDGYIDENDTFKLTEKGLKWLEEHGEDS